jgi:pyruvate dehydrogenase E2 component (dihydrolipoamide acetyltransferase)
MPALGMAQDTGTLIRWLKKEGDQVAKGEPLMEVETDKATVEIEAAANGILARVTAQDGDVIPVAQVIALILAPGEAAPDESNGMPSGASRGESPVMVMAASQGQTAGASPVALKVAEEHRVDISQVTPRDGARIKKADVLAYVDALAVSERPREGAKLAPASPKARRLAAQRGIDLGSIHGSGPEGAVLVVDVPAAAPEAISPESPTSGETLEISRAWRVMAERLSAGWAEVPHFYLTREIDATRLIAWREASLAKTGEKITYTDLLVKAAAAALEQHPRVNSSWHEGQIALNPSINVGLAVATDDGLIVPVIHGANQLTVRQIAAKRKALVERAGASKLRLDDLQGGTFTISNLGMYGVDAFNAIVNPPEAAILAVGRIADRVIPVDGQPAVRPMMVLTLSCDHRVIDGARGAQFLDTLVSIIEEPMRLID